MHNNSEISIITQSKSVDKIIIMCIQSHLFNHCNIARQTPNRKAQ